MNVVLTVLRFIEFLCDTKSNRTASGGELWGHHKENGTRWGFFLEITGRPGTQLNACSARLACPRSVRASELHCRINVGLCSQKSQEITHLIRSKWNVTRSFVSYIVSRINQKGYYTDAYHVFVLPCACLMMVGEGGGGRTDGAGVIRSGFNR